MHILYIIITLCLFLTPAIPKEYTGDWCCGQGGCVLKEDIGYPLCPIISVKY